MSVECADQNTDKEDEETSDLICKHMHMKIMWSLTLNHIHENCLMLLSEISIQELVKEALGVLMEAIYCILTLIILLNMIQM